MKLLWSLVLSLCLPGQLHGVSAYKQRDVYTNSSLSATPGNSPPEGQYSTSTITAICIETATVKFTTIVATINTTVATTTITFITITETDPYRLMHRALNSPSPKPISPPPLITTITTCTSTFTVTLITTVPETQKITVDKLITETQTVKARVPGVPPVGVPGTTSTEGPKPGPVVTPAPPPPSPVESPAPLPPSPAPPPPPPSPVQTPLPAPGPAPYTTTIGGNPIIVLPLQSPSGGLVIDGNTLLPGSALTSNGIILNNGPGGLAVSTIAEYQSPGAVIASILGITSSAPIAAATNSGQPANSPASITTPATGVITPAAGVTTLQGSNPTVIQGSTLTPGGTLVLSSTTYLLPINPTETTAPEAQTSTRSSTLTANPSQATVIDGQTLTPGGTLVVAGSTITLPTNPSQATVIDGQTLTPGGTLVVAGSTITLPLGPSLTGESATGSATSFVQAGSGARVKARGGIVGLVLGVGAVLF